MPMLCTIQISTEVVQTSSVSGLCVIACLKLQMESEIVCDNSHSISALHYTLVWLSRTVPSAVGNSCTDELERNVSYSKQTHYFPHHDFELMYIVML